jgi:hypothetical protein
MLTDADISKVEYLGYIIIYAEHHANETKLNLLNKQGVTVILDILYYPDVPRIYIFNQFRRISESEFMPIYNLLKKILTQKPRYRLFALTNSDFFKNSYI